MNVIVINLAFVSWEQAVLCVIFCRIILGSWLDLSYEGTWNNEKWQMHILLSLLYPLLTASIAQVMTSELQSSVIINYPICMYINLLLLLFID